jgi:hypothetical protein
MRFMRVLPLLCLLSLLRVSLAQKSATSGQQVPETCPITNALAHPFVPPGPYLASRGVNWFGTDGLWTFLPSDGIWGQGNKTFWFREEWGRYKGSDQWIPAIDSTKLEVTARRLDGPASSPEVGQASSSYRQQDWKAFLVGGINFPTPGCWEVSARYENDELTFVVWVVSDGPKRQTHDQAVPLSIVVDKSCLIQPESDPLVFGDHINAFRDDAICHLESVLSSHHIEEKITDGQRSRLFVRVAEQEYVVQNPTDKPAVLIVRHEVPENWTVDSDPEPTSMEGATALFRLNAEPGQRVRLHVGMHVSDSINPN